jgi:hypothetical protein
MKVSKVGSYFTKRRTIMNKAGLVFLLITLVASTCAMAQSEAQKNFDTMKTLAGSWKGKTSDGRLDGDRLMMTHYCGAGNQPRMKAETSSDGKTVAFDFLDATNLPSPETGHMQRAVFTVADANHHTEEWVFTKDGKEHKELFAMERVK